MKTNYLKWLLFVFAAVIFGLVTSHFSITNSSFYESTTTIIASLALLRTCKEEK